MVEIYFLFQTGDYQIVVTATNPLSSVSKTFNITIVDSLTNVNVSDNGVITKPGKAKTFTISFDSVGLQTCIAVDYGDLSYKNYYGNNSDSCQKLFSVLPTGALTNPLQVSHKFELIFNE